MLESQSVTHRRAAARRPTPLALRDYIAVVLTAVTVPPLLARTLVSPAPEKLKQWIITVLFVVFGGTMLLGAGDAYRHQLAVEIYYSQISFQQFLDELRLILSFQVTPIGGRDVYRHVVGYFFGGVLQAPWLFFPFVAGVYGYFFGGSVLHVLRHFQWSKANYVLIGVVGVFLLLKSVEGVQTVRTWTGMWILIYACLKYHEEKKLRYLLLMFVPPFIHYSYFLMAVPAWIVLTFGSRPTLYAALLVLSSVTNFIPGGIKESLSRTELGAVSVASYGVTTQRNTSFDGWLEESRESNWYAAYGRSGLGRWAPLIFAFGLIGTGIYAGKMTPYQRKILSIGILMLAFSNFIWFFTAMHNRSLFIASNFILAAFLMARFNPRSSHIFRHQPPYYQWALHASLLLFLPIVAFNTSILLDRMSLYMFGIPFWAMLFPDLNIALKDAINFVLGRG